MSRRAFPSNTISATVRERLGLSRQELGDWLGVGQRQVGHVEAGRREYSAKAQARLRRLSELVPRLPEETPEPVAPAAALPSPAEATALRARLRTCRHEARQLRYQQDAWPERDVVIGRRQRGLAALEAAIADESANPAADLSRERAWLEILALGTRQLARRLPTPTAREWVALRLRLLDEEAAGLEKLLAGSSAA